MIECLSGVFRGLDLKNLRWIYQSDLTGCCESHLIPDTLAYLKHPSADNGVDGVESVIVWIASCLDASWCNVSAERFLLKYFNFYEKRKH